MLSFSNSCPDSIKFPYFADTTERGDGGAKAEEIGGETEGDFTDNSILQTYWMSSPPLFFATCFINGFYNFYHMSFLMVGDTTELSFLLSLALRFFWRIIMVIWIAKILDFLLGSGVLWNIHNLS
jgi:hypothetical protein